MVRFMSEKRKKGQAIVEFALALPLLLLLIFGVLELGRAFQTKIVLTNAAREGTHYFIYDIDDSPSFTKTIAATVAESNNSGVQISTVDVTVHCYVGATLNDDCPAGSTVEVIVQNVFKLNIFGFDWNELIIKSDARMLVP
jgi:Flp pilus assembly protein TadG